MAKGSCTGCWIALGLLAAGNIAFAAWGISQRANFKQERSHLYAIIDEAREAEALAKRKAEAALASSEEHRQARISAEEEYAKLEASLEGGEAPTNSLESCRTYAHKVRRQRDLLKEALDASKLEAKDLRDALLFKDDQLASYHAIDDAQGDVIEKTAKQVRREKVKKGFLVAGVGVATGFAGYGIGRATN